MPSACKYAIIHTMAPLPLQLPPTFCLQFPEKSPRSCPYSLFVNSLLLFTFNLLQAGFPPHCCTPTPLLILISKSSGPFSAHISLHHDQPLSQRITPSSLRHSLGTHDSILFSFPFKPLTVSSQVPSLVPLSAQPLNVGPLPFSAGLHSHPGG